MSPRKQKQRWFMGVLALAVCGIGSAQAQPNIVRNGSFEAHAPDNGVLYWDVVVTEGMVFTGRSTDAATDGNVCFDLGVLEKPRIGRGSTVGQDLALEKGRRYLLSFAYATGYKGRHSGYEELYVSLDGQTVWRCDLAHWYGETSDARTGFSKARLLFAAGENTTRLEFGKRGLKNSGRGWAFHSLIDAVVVVRAGPESKGVAVSADSPHQIPKPPKHLVVDAGVFAETMAHISDADLLEALTLDHVALQAVKEARTVSDSAALTAFCRHLAQGQRPVDTVSTEAYRDELEVYRRTFPGKDDSLARLFNGIYEWTRQDADRVAAGEHLYAGAKSTWVAFRGGKVDWVTNHGNIYGFHYFGSLQPLFLAWLETGDESYANAYASAFEDWWDQRDAVNPQWCVWYKLGLAIRGRRLARALHHMAGTPSFDAQTQTHILKTILGGCRWLMADWEISPAWTSNWGLFVATGLIRMGVLFPEFREAESWRKQGATIMKRYARTFKPDGGTEALGYHKGILNSLFRPHDLLVRNGHDGYLDSPELREGIARGLHILTRMTMPDGRYPAIGDAFYGRSDPPLLHGARLLQDQETKGLLLALGAQAIADRGAYCVTGFVPFRSQQELRDRLAPDTLHKPWVPRSYVFPHQGLSVLRRGGDLGSAVYLAVSHGVHGHSHPDFLGITLFAHGRLLMGDRGVPSYYGPHTSDMRRSKAHSTLTVDGQDMKAVMPRLNMFETSPDADIWQCTSAAYQGLGVENIRTIVHIKHTAPCFVIIDQIVRTSSDKRTLDVYFHSSTDTVDTLSPEQVTFGAGPVVTIAVPPGNGERRQGKEWSITHETSLVTKQFPFIAFRKVSAETEYFCAVLACDPARRRDVRVACTPSPTGGIRTIGTEGNVRFLVAVNTDSPSAGETKMPAGDWTTLLGNGQPVQLFRSG
ncbi:MAG: hypothetical protein HON70_32060, partial [Lentisphaerae bacterium]|nr:hypothetical protein [Lentisphaerota bacterium]